MYNMYDQCGGTTSLLLFVCFLQKKMGKNKVWSFRSLNRKNILGPFKIDFFLLFISIKQSSNLGITAVLL